MPRRVMMIRNSIKVWILALLCVSTSGFAQYHPPDGAENVYELISPIFLGGGISVVSINPPQSEALNPSLAALSQRALLDASYLALIDFTGGEGWGGHVVVGGISEQKMIKIIVFYSINEESNYFSCGRRR